MRLHYLFGVAFLLFVSFARPANAQKNPTGTISGAVSDPSGAAIVGATVSAQPAGSAGSAGPAVRTVSGGDGRFSVALPAGRYRMSVAHKSFENVEQEITVATGETREWSVRLQLERASSNVVVTDSAEPALAETAPDLVDVITRPDIDQRHEIWLTDMLASKQGLTFSRLGAYGGITSFFLDGGDSDYTKVLGRNAGE